MPTLSEYFDTEARDNLALLDAQLEHQEPDISALYRATRAIRGSAQMARADHVLRAAAALESALRSTHSRALAWSSDISSRVRQSVADLHTLVDHGTDETKLDAVADDVVERWREVGQHPSLHTPRTPADAPLSSSGEFRAFVGREVAAIADVLDAGIQQLASAPMDREPLKIILRRQRVLLGAARLGEVPVVAEILHAIDDLTRVIAKLDVGVKREWLDIYRVAREGLRATLDPLQRDEDPAPTHALSRLRHMRVELLERYGAGEAVSAAHESHGLTQVIATEPATDTTQHEVEEDVLVLSAADIVTDAPVDDATDDDAVDDELLLLDEEIVADAPALDDDDVAILDLTEDAIVAVVSASSAEHEDPDAAVPIESLVYQREDALRRALQLHDVLARAHADDPAAREAVDEVFDLINIALH
jgi:chemotaxis protein histidine kinase CheA